MCVVSPLMSCIVSFWFLVPTEINAKQRISRYRPSRVPLRRRFAAVCHGLVGTRLHCQFLVFGFPSPGSQRSLSREWKAQCISTARGGRRDGSLMHSARRNKRLRREGATDKRTVRENALNPIPERPYTPSAGRQVRSR